mmetsp:Transcript_29590/g.83408  ORF Transcript_29590/g.83408 Transcript_29590/m.83408 type:complete len:220 (-) Transcript_29590:778-1437(-)
MYFSADLLPSRAGASSLLMPKAAVKAMHCFALQTSCARKSSVLAHCSRGEKSTTVSWPVTPPESASTPAPRSFAAGRGESSSLKAAMSAFSGSSWSFSQYCRYFPQATGSRMTWPTFQCPKMAPAVMFVEPVHTATASPPGATRTKNLLWLMALTGLVRCRTQPAARPAACSAQWFRCWGPRSVQVFFASDHAPIFQSTTKATSTPRSRACARARRTGM